MVDEPTFRLVGSDPAAAALVHLWIYTRRAPIDVEAVAAALDRAQEMEEWCKGLGYDPVPSILALLPYDLLAKELGKRNGHE